MPGCMLESLRLYPFGMGGVPDRVCVKDYHLKGAGITVRKGTLIMAPYQNMVRDPRFFPDPDTFDPTRWTKENSTDRNKFLQFQFGRDHGVCSTPLQDNCWSPTLKKIICFVKLQQSLVKMLVMLGISIHMCLGQISTH